MRKILAIASLGILAACAAPKEVEEPKPVEVPVVEGYGTEFKSTGFVIYDKANGYPELSYTKLTAESEPDCVLKFKEGRVFDRGCDGGTIESMEIYGCTYLAPEGEDYELGLKLMGKYREEMGFDGALQEYEDMISTKQLEKYL